MQPPSNVTLPLLLASLLLGCGSRPGPVTDPHATYSASVVCPPDLVTGQIEETPGRLGLTVIDVFGNPLPESEVVLSMNGVDTMHVTGQDGRLVVEDLRPGKRSIVVSQPGFVDGVIDAVPVERGCVTAVMVPLRVVDVVD